VKEVDEESIGRKIKVLRYDHVEQCKDSFLQFGQNNGIETHFTNEKDGSQKDESCLTGEGLIFVV